MDFFLSKIFVWKKKWKIEINFKYLHHYIFIILYIYVYKKNNIKIKNKFWGCTQINFINVRIIIKNIYYAFLYYTVYTYEHENLTFNQ